MSPYFLYGTIGEALGTVCIHQSSKYTVYKA
jgi:hypothetical protein